MVNRSVIVNIIQVIEFKVKYINRLRFCNYQPGFEIALKIFPCSQALLIGGSIYFHVLDNSCSRVVLSMRKDGKLIRDTLRLGCLGFTEPDLKVMKSMLTLVRQLSDRYTYCDSENLTGVDLMMVNTDDPEAFGQWQEMSFDRLIPAIMVSSGTDHTGSTHVTMLRPFRLRSLIQALEEVSRTSNLFSGDDNGISASNLDFGDELSILVVDESYPVRQFMKSSLIDLVKIPINLGFAASGEEALAKVGQCQYDLIFLDVMMEGLCSIWRLRRKWGV